MSRGGPSVSAREFQSRPPGGAVLTQQADGQQDRGAEGDVDEEHRAPRGAKEIGLGENAAERGTGDGGRTHDGADAAHGPGQLAAVEQCTDHADGLGG